jgi:hypothetical protein
MNPTSEKLRQANEQLAASMKRKPRAATSPGAAPIPRPRIVLAVIYGNEEAVMARFIESFRPAADAFVFVRAIGGLPPDKTEGIIQTEIVKGSPHMYFAGEYVNAPHAADWPHVDDFGAARQKAWDLAAATGAEWLMWADCDDVLAPGAAEAIRAACQNPDAKDVLLCPYDVSFQGKQIVIRERIVRNNGCARWQHAIHEQLTFTRPVTYRNVPGAVVRHSPLPGKAGRSDRNARILAGQLADTPRNLYYLANEHLNLGDRGGFLQLASSALALTGLDAESRYDLYLTLAQTESGPKAKEWAALAYGVMPDRREALGLLAGYALLEGRNREAMAFGTLLANIPKPTRSYWTLNHEWYGWKGEDMIARCMRANGNEAGAEARLLANAGPGGFTFSVIHATLWRGPMAETVRAIWLSRAKHPEKVDYCFGFHECDEDTRRYLGSYRHSVCPSPDGKPQGAIANGDCAVALAKGKILVPAQDDLIPPVGWDELLLAKIGGASLDAPMFIATSDGIRPDDLCTSPIMSRAYQQQKRADCDGTGLGHSGYHSMYWDNEVTFRAKADAAAGRCVWVDAKDVVFFHNHPSANRAIPIDATYREQNDQRHYESGRKLFLERNPTATLEP